MLISSLVSQVRKLDLPKNEYAIFGSAVMAIRGLREAPNIDVIVKNGLWESLLETYQPDGEGFIKIGIVKISNWWFAPLRKDLSDLIDEAEEISGLPYVKLEEVLAYKKGLNRDKDKVDVRLIEKYLESMAGDVQINLGVDTYKKLLLAFTNIVEREIPEVICMMVFGSVSRGRAKGDSDIDMFVFYDDSKIGRDTINKKLNEIILKLRESREYKELELKNIYPEIYPFLISKRESSNLLWVFLDAILDGLIIMDNNDFGKNIKGEFKNRLDQQGGRRVDLGEGKWCWLLFKDYTYTVNNLKF